VSRTVAATGASYPKPTPFCNTFLQRFSEIFAPRAQPPQNQYSRTGTFFGKPNQKGRNGPKGSGECAGKSSKSPSDDREIGAETSDYYIHSSEMSTKKPDATNAPGFASGKLRLAQDVTRIGMST
jgi:hypothetical protein